MEKGNKIRFVVWGLVWLVVTAATIFGINAYYSGYGVSGKLRKELMPVIEKFNSLSALDVYKNVGIKIEATLSGKGIKVVYSSQASNLTFMFDYEVIDDEHVLQTKYNKVDETTGILVVSSMYDAVALTKGYYEGDLFERYGYGDLYNTEIKQGGKIVVDNNNTIAYINLNKTLLDDETGLVLDSLYISEDNLLNMNSALTQDKSFTYTKDKTKLYVESTDDKYIMYIRNGAYDNNLYKSVKSVINTLDISSETKEEFAHSYPSISNSTEFGSYIITIDTDVENMTYFEEKDKVLKIEILKSTKQVENNTPVENEDLNENENAEN